MRSLDYDIDSLGISHQLTESETASFGNSFSGGLSPANLASGSLVSEIEQQAGTLFNGKTAFDNTQTGYRLGIDNGTAKFYIGSSSNYLNWDGSALTISGNLTATTGTIGGFTIGATTLTGSNLVLDSSGQRISLGSSNDIIILDADDATYRMWIGNATAASAPFRVEKDGSVIATDFTATGGSISSVAISSIPNSTATDISLLEYTHTMVFSVTDNNTVAWASGTITMSNGRTFSITGSNTGNMAARTYIYLDTGTSTTALQTTTTASTAMGANKILIAVAENGSGQATYQVYGGIGGLKIGSAGINIANNNWTYSGTWSVTDADTVAWGSGTLKTSDGTSYSITGSNTGNMSAKTYIYFDLGTSSTAFQTTTTATTAIGDGKILIAIAQNGTGEANYMVVNDKQHNIDAANIVAGSITANEIAASTITAAKLSVSQLSAIAADMGTLTAGTVTGATIQTASSGTRFVMTSSAFQGKNSSGNNIFEVIISGGDAGDVIMGDDATGSYAKWDNSASTFEVFADNVPTLNVGTFGGDGSDGALAISSGTTSIDLSGARVVVKNYTSVSITGTGKLAFTNPHASGTAVIIKSQGNVTLTSSNAAMIDCSNTGAAGGAAVTQSSNGTNPGNHGTDGTTGFTFWSSNNGVAANGATDGEGGAALSSALAYKTDDENVYASRYPWAFVGAGGGSGTASFNGGPSAPGTATSGAGGRGGGALVIECAGALNFTTGGISVGGSDGGNGSTGTTTSAAASGGGGGGGGYCLILYNALTANSGTIDISGGTGGQGAVVTTAGSEGGQNGGGGGGGYTAGANGEDALLNAAADGGNGGDGLSFVIQNKIFA